MTQKNFKRFYCRFLALYISILFIAGCASFSVTQSNQEPKALASHSREIALDVYECRENLSREILFPGAELDSTEIKVLNWNIKKGQMAEWRNDLMDLAAGKNLVIIQEAIHHADFIEALEQRNHWSFTKGYKTKSQVTGVMTFSDVEPITQCSLTSWEPWLGTPKTINITEYGLSGIDETLVVVNIHAINFSFGVSQFQQQIDQIKHALADHEGPIILSGDFNTWRKKRMTILESLATELELDALSFQEDHRTSVFGYHLDHIYVRALKTENTATYLVNSSDHNPLTATFRL